MRKNNKKLLAVLILTVLLSLGFFVLKSNFLSSFWNKNSTLIIATSNHNYFPKKIEIEKGIVCYLIPGTAGIIANGENIGQWFYYNCGNNTVILGPLDNIFDKTNRLWRVNVAQLDEGEDQIGKTKNLKVLKVWQ